MIVALCDLYNIAETNVARNIQLRSDFSGIKLSR